MIKSILHKAMINLTTVTTTKPQFEMMKCLSLIGNSQKDTNSIMNLFTTKYDSLMIAQNWQYDHFVFILRTYNYFRS